MRWYALDSTTFVFVPFAWVIVKQIICRTTMAVRRAEDFIRLSLSVCVELIQLGNVGNNFGYECLQLRCIAKKYATFVVPDVSLPLERLC